jgi:hypothetical protein
MPQLGRKNQGKKKRAKVRNNMTVGANKHKPQGHSVSAIEDRLRKAKCWGEMLDMLAIGTKMTDIVHFAKVEKNEYEHISPETLERYLLWFVEGRGKEYIQMRCPSKMKLYEASMYDFDVFMAHKMLAAIQFERVTNAVDREKEMRETEKELKAQEDAPKSEVIDAQKKYRDAANFASKQVDLLNTIMKSLNEEEIQRNTKRVATRFFHSLGGDQNGSSVVMAVEKVKEQYAQRWGETTAKVVLDPESRRRLLNVIERVRASNTLPVKRVLDAQIVSREDKDETEETSSPSET